MEAKIHLNLPNILTLSRFFLAPLFLYILTTQRVGIAIAVLVLALLTDIADGFAARMVEQTTIEGMFIDPLADKVFAVWVAAGLLINGFATLPQLALLLTRDILILLIGGIAQFLTKKQLFPTNPSYLGKAVTGLQYVAVVILLLQSSWSTTLLYAVAILSILCVADYARRWQKPFKAA